MALAVVRALSNWARQFTSGPGSVALTFLIVLRASFRNQLLIAKAATQRKRNCLSQLGRCSTATRA